MAKNFLTPIDLNGNEARNVAAQNLATAPASPATGRFWFDTTVGALMVFNGAANIVCDPARVPNGSIPIAKLATDPLARGNHTGTQTAGTISDLAATVQAYRLDQFAAPTAPVSFNGQRLSNVATPTAATDGTPKSYVDSAVQAASAGIDNKPSVRVVATANQALTGLGTAVDGITLAAGDRVLCVGQTTASQNGVYLAASGAWTRATDTLTPQSFWLVEEGTSYGSTQWKIATSGAITAGATALTINQFGATQPYAAGNGLSLTGATFAVLPAPGGGLTVSGTGVAVDAAVVTRKVAATIGDGAATSYAVTHNLATSDVQVQVFRSAAPFDTVEVDVQRTNANTVAVVFAAAPAANAFRVLVQG